MADDFEPATLHSSTRPLCCLNPLILNSLIMRDRSISVLASWTSSLNDDDDNDNYDHNDEDDEDDDDKINDLFKIIQRQ